MSRVEADDMTEGKWSVLQEKFTSTWSEWVCKISRQTITLIAWPWLWFATIPVINCLDVLNFARIIHYNRKMYLSYFLLFHLSDGHHQWPNTFPLLRSPSNPNQSHPTGETRRIIIFLINFNTSLTLYEHKNKTDYANRWAEDDTK